MVKHQANSADEKQLQAHLKRLGLNNIPGAPDWPGVGFRSWGRSGSKRPCIEEVNMFTEDGGVLLDSTALWVDDY